MEVKCSICGLMNGTVTLSCLLGAKSPKATQEHSALYWSVALAGSLLTRSRRSFARGALGGRSDAVLPLHLGHQGAPRAPSPFCLGGLCSTVDLGSK